MASFNQTTLMGNLVRDVELRHTGQGTAVTDISLAVNDRVKSGGEWIDETSFFDVTLWGRMAEIASEYLAKGSQVLISGRLKQEQWEQNGQKRSKVKIVASELKMVGIPNRGTNPDQSQPANNQSLADDEIPF